MENVEAFIYFSCMNRFSHSFIMPNRCLLLLIFFGHSLWLSAQVDSTAQVPDATQEIIEDFLQNTDSDGDFDFNTIFEDLEVFLKKPVDINQADEVRLQELSLLNDAQINNLINYRKLNGDLISLYELQAVPGFDLETIRRVLPFITLKTEIDDYQIPITEMLRQGKNEYFLRWSRILEQQKGYIPLESGQFGSKYLGDPNSLYFRFKHSYSNKLSYGLTTEKDRGEEFFKGSNTQGFDFYSAHFYLQNYNKHIKAVALGDYSVSLGQGLILFSGFGGGKSSSPMLIKRAGRVIRPYSSVNEAMFMRGAATTMTFGNFDISVFYSSMRTDANLIQTVDTLDQEEAIREFSSFRTDGLHRTFSEIADENTVRQNVYGGSLKFKKNNWHLALNGIQNTFDKTLQTTPRPYNQFYFRGNRLSNISLDYALLFKNFNFFGETASSDNGSIATVNGLIVSLDRFTSLSILHRSYPKDYQALNANPFAETSGARNENGLYLGLEIRPGKKWILSGYFDTWRHPWIRFNADAPYTGYEFRSRITYFKKRTYLMYFEVREEHKFTNSPTGTTNIKLLTPTTLFQTRLHFSNQLSKFLELRSRIDWGYFKSEFKGFQKGFVALQDVIFKPIDFPLHFTTRFAIFDTDGYDIRFYHFENDLLYTFSIPAYYNKGTRFYLNLRYRGIPNLIIEGRFSQTYWQNQRTFGSGLDEIKGPARSQVSAQIKYQF